ncbi:nSTAND1 domain-containing NTPase [Rugosimonospora africana]|uniref:nSTAND1 domain-containing NTPase n=1 Tax=Rugosimonospora africana TaxID=556532 RepID=UPI001EF1FC49|nr:helix-turn-helix domain-containing protein [Rugosimonospora africana]
MTNFAADLRRLREKAGSPPYRELARRAHYSSTTLADAAGGRRLPSLSVTRAYVRACGGDPSGWEARWHEVAAELAEPVPDESTDAEDARRCPYAGLAAFGPDDAGRYFGREQLTEDLIARVRKHRVVIAFGASGSGKSSLLRAGLIPKLSEDGRLPLLFTPGSHPLEECAARLAALTGGSAATLHRELNTDPLALHLSALQALTAGPRGATPAGGGGDRPARRADDGELLIVVDQFEEVFTLCHSQRERTAFIAALTAAARADNSRTRVVLGVRSDFYAHCMEYPDLVDALRDAQLLVGPMSTEELRRAVSQPATDAGCTIEGALVARVVADATGQAGVLPLVSHALRETWSRRRGNTLTLVGYEASGGMRHALARTAESVYTGLTAEQQRLARGVFLRLVALGEGTDDTKRRVNRDQLDPGTAPVVDALANARLVTVDVSTVELTHEALLHAWPRLRGWIDQDRAGLLMHQQLADATTLWEREGHDPGALYRGGRLAAALEWAQYHRDDLPIDGGIAQFLTASKRQESRAARMRTAALVVLSALTLIASAAAGVALQQRSAARQDLNRAVGTQTTVEGEQVRATDVSLSAQLSLAAHRIQPTPQTYTDLLSTETAPLAISLGGFKDTVFGVAFSRDGKLLATGAKDGTVRLWNLSDPARPVPYGDPVQADRKSVYWVAVSPDGKTLATADRDGTVGLWGIADPRHPRRLAHLAAHRGITFSVAFSPDGRTLVSAGDDATFRLWNVSDPAHAQPWGPGVLAGSDALASAEFSPDGHLVATAGHDGRIGLWNVTDPSHPVLSATAVGSTGAVLATAFSPDGNTLASVGVRHTARLWDVHDPTRLVPLGDGLTGHDDTVFAVAFSPDGRTLATAGADQGIRLWNVTDPAHALPLGEPLTGHTGYVYWLAFSPDGTLASAGGDKTVRLWDLPHTVVACPSYLNGVAFTKDGDLLATASTDGTVRLWDVTDPAHPTQRGEPLTAHHNAVISVAFDPRQPILATGSRDRTVLLWDVSQPDHPRQLGGALQAGTGEVSTVRFSANGVLAVADLDGTIQLWDVTNPANPRRAAMLQQGDVTAAHGVHAVAFSADGTLLASAGADDTVRLWNVSDPDSPVAVATPLESQSGGVLDVAFSPDGHTLATANQDHSVRLWDVRDPAHPVRIGQNLTGHTSFVYSVSFSADGRTLASSSQDDTIRLWNVTDPAHPTAMGQPLIGHTAPIDEVAFGPDPHRQVLASASDDHTLALTELDAGQAARRICAVTGGVLDRAQWRQYIPELRFDPPCANGRPE